MPRRIASKKGCHGVMLIELRMIYLGQVVWVAALDTHKHGHLLVHCTWFDNIFLYEDYMKIIWRLYEDYMKIMWILKYGDNMGMLLLIIWHHTSFWGFILLTHREKRAGKHGIDVMSPRTRMKVGERTHNRPGTNMIPLLYIFIYLYKYIYICNYLISPHTWAGN